MTKDAKTKIKELQKELLSLTKSFLETEFLKIFKKYPDLKSFSWTQYAPSFNDGDPCYFNVYGTYEINEVNVEEDWDGNEKVEVFKMLDKDARKAIDDIDKIIDSIKESTMEDLFGNGTLVTVKNKDGKIVFKKSEYNDGDDY